MVNSWIHDFPKYPLVFGEIVIVALFGSGTSCEKYSILSFKYTDMKRWQQN